MAEWAGFILEVAKCLFNCTKANEAYVCKLEKNVASLEKKRGDLQKKENDVQIEIQRAESTGMERTDEGKGWLEDVGNLEKGTKDILEEIQEVHNNNCVGGYCPKNCVLSYKLGKKTVEILREAEELLIKAPNINFTRKPPKKTVDEMPIGETVGLDLMVDNVWNSIKDDDVGIIGLYGMGGVGKTILMKRIHNEFGRREPQFDLVLWVVVSRDHDINKIMNDIRNRLGIDDNFWNINSDQDQRLANIYQRLKQRKFVLMLDDLWGKLELEMVGVPYPKETNNKSKVLFTTRSQDVCAKMQAKKKYKVECLLEKEAIDLFHKKVGDETLKSHKDIPWLAMEMAKECGGLPLALITVGSAMAGESVEAWRQANKDLRNSSWTSLDSKHKVFSILEPSYDELPFETHKSCFRYLALYPKDSEIDTDDLIDRWIGEGFLGEDRNKKSVYDMLEQGKSIIEKLKLSSLIEGTTYSGIKMHNVVRDMALWLARDKDANKDKVFVEAEALAVAEMDPERLNAVERISIINSVGMLDVEERVSIVNPTGVWRVPTCPNLITLCIRLLTLIITDYANLQSMKRLKVLYLTGYSSNDDVPSEIGELINLEFLNLSRINIQYELPIELKNLKNLRVFLMEYGRCGLAIIPLEVIEILKQLKVFRFTTLNIPRELNRGFEQEEAFLEKLESLPKLEELCIQLTSINGINKLFSSTKLLSCLRHFKLYDVRDDVQDKLFDARDKFYDVGDDVQNKLSDARDKQDKLSDARDKLYDVRDDVQDKLSDARDKLHDAPLSKLEKKKFEKKNLLAIYKLRDVQKVPEKLEMSLLLASFSKMKHLDRISLSFVRDIKDSSVNDTCHLGKLRLVQIECCHSITHLTWLKYAPLLESIDVIDCNSIEEVVMVKEGEDGDGDIFSNLMHLRLMGLPRLKRIHKRALGFPSLKYIIVSNCPNLKKLPFNSSFAAKDNLITFEGEDKWWKKLQWEDTDTSIKHLLNSKLNHSDFEDSVQV